MQREIIVPETKPATEWILGRAVQKVSPKLRHSLLQGWWSEHLRPWARGRGLVGPEWRFRVAPPGEMLRPLVPDIAYISYERLGDAEGEERESPTVAPDVAIEILSPGDKAAHVVHKVGVYLAAGAKADIAIDPAARTLTIHDANGVRVLGTGDTFAHDALPGFTFAIVDMFAELDAR